MHVTPIKTAPIKANEQSLEKLLDTAIDSFENNQVLAVTSKVVSLCEGAVVPIDTVTKAELVRKEADYYLPAETNQYGFCISIKNHTIIASAGIDESNGNGNFVLWPKNPQESANRIRAYIRNRFNLQHVGVVITDSHVLPLRWGVQGTCLAYSGFAPLKNYMGQPDLFGRKLKVTKANHAEGLAAAAVLVMGEGDESTPFARISDIPFLSFVDQDPSDEEIRQLSISIEEDVFSPLLRAVSWKQG